MKSAISRYSGPVLRWLLARRRLRAWTESALRRAPCVDRKARALLRRIVVSNDSQHNVHRSLEDVFTEIYDGNHWGGSDGELHSGSGSREEKTVGPYVDMATSQAQSEGFHGLAFVDLGCGDFYVGRRLLPLCSEYIGVDVVARVVQENKAAFGTETTRFERLDIVSDDLPDGDVCFIRQVLQHLSNDEICAVLQKLDKYRWVYITEHYPTDNDAIAPNIEKVHGGHIRVDQNSGVYLSLPPFGLPPETLSLVLEVPGVGQAEGDDQGVIRTFLYEPVQAGGDYADHVASKPAVAEPAGGLSIKVDLVAPALRWMLARRKLVAATRLLLHRFPNLCRRLGDGMRSGAGVTAGLPEPVNDPLPRKPEHLPLPARAVLAELLSARARGDSTGRS